jgi:hypothetical protein
MNKKTTENAFSIHPITLGEWTWEDNIMIFTPQNQLKYNTNYTIRLTDDAECANGCNIVEDYQWRFTTSTKPSDSGPANTGPSETGKDDDKTLLLNTGVIALLIAVIITVIVITIFLIILKRKRSSAGEVQQSEEGPRTGVESAMEYKDQHLYQQDGLSSGPAQQLVTEQPPMYTDISEVSGEYVESEPEIPAAAGTTRNTVFDSIHPQQHQYQPVYPMQQLQPVAHAQIQQPISEVQCHQCGTIIQQPGWCPNCGQIM